MEAMKIVLIGAGQIGSRHLQGLAKLQIPCEISVYDPSEQALTTAQQRFYEVADGASTPRLLSSSKMDALPKIADMAVIATNSDTRLTAMRELLSRTRVRKILLEKFLFNSFADFEEAEKLLAKFAVEAWVNCPRRLFPQYRYVKDLMNRDESPLTMRVEGANWGLASNAVHFLDLFSFISGENHFDLDASGVDAIPVESKRKGFVELSGRIEGSSRSGRLAFSLESKRVGPLSVSLSFESSRGKIRVNETAGSFELLAVDSKDDLKEVFAMPRQSELSGKIAEAILTGSDCGLPSYCESAEIHKALLRLFTAHLAKYGTSSERIPIT